MNRGQLFILSGPSGSGKDSILMMVLQRLPELKLSISTITRPMRKGEVEGEKYNFISKEKFLNMLESNEFLEHNEYLGNYYGTPKTPVEECLLSGQDIILEIDVNGADNVRKIMPEAVGIFIIPPTLPELERRLCNRGTENREVALKRLKESVAEIKRACEYDYIIVNNNLDEAVENLVAIIISEKSRINRKKYLIDEVLKDAESCNW